MVFLPLITSVDASSYARWLVANVDALSYADWFGSSTDSRPGFFFDVFDFFDFDR